MEGGKKRKRKGKEETSESHVILVRSALRRAAGSLKPLSPAPLAARWAGPRVWPSVAPAAASRPRVHCTH